MYRARSVARTGRSLLNMNTAPSGKWFGQVARQPIQTRAGSRPNSPTTSPIFFITASDITTRPVEGGQAAIQLGNLGSSSSPAFNDGATPKSCCSTDSLRTILSDRLTGSGLLQTLVEAMNVNVSAALCFPRPEALKTLAKRLWRMWSSSGHGLDMPRIGAFVTLLPTEKTASLTATRRLITAS